MTGFPRVCIIGAGSSGFPVAKALQDANVPFDIFEMGDRVGGNWVYENSNRVSSAYKSLHINTSRVRMQYADFPMPDDYPDYPGHERIARYFEAYVDRFGLRERITFRTRVDRCRRREADGTWDVTLHTGETRRYDALVVANGHHWDPRWPDPPIPGAFGGLEMHSHHYRTPRVPHDLRGKRVVVVGMGNSAMDIACELSNADVARRVLLSIRHTAYVIPKYLFGRPLDTLGLTAWWIPLPVQRMLLSLGMRMLVGRMEDYGLPAPRHDVLAAHPTVSGEFLLRLGSGDIAVKPTIRRKDGARVEFDDGSVEEVDAIVYATGYNVSFPFFDPGFLAARDNDLPLFFRTISPGIDDLFFIGLLQPLGAVMPIAERQGKWMAEYLTGRYALPPRREMERRMQRDHEAMRRRYLASPRHTMQVDFDRYMYALAREMAAGRRRARRRGFELPIPPRATAEVSAATGIPPRA